MLCAKLVCSASVRTVINVNVLLPEPLRNRRATTRIAQMLRYANQAAHRKPRSALSPLSQAETQDYPRSKPPHPIPEMHHHPVPAKAHHNPISPKIPAKTPAYSTGALRPTRASPQSLFPKYPGKRFCPPQALHSFEPRTLHRTSRCADRVSSLPPQRHQRIPRDATHRIRIFVSQILDLRWTG